MVYHKTESGKTQDAKASPPSDAENTRIGATFIVNPNLPRKGKCISLVEGTLLKNIISQKLNNYVDDWGEKNQKIRLPKAE